MCNTNFSHSRQKAAAAPVTAAGLVEPAQRRQTGGHAPGRAAAARPVPAAAPQCPAPLALVSGDVWSRHLQQAAGGAPSSTRGPGPGRCRDLCGATSPPGRRGAQRDGAAGPAARPPAPVTLTAGPPFGRQPRGRGERCQGPAAPRPCGRAPAGTPPAGTPPGRHRPGEGHTRAPAAPAPRAAQGSRRVPPGSP